MRRIYPIVAAVLAVTLMFNLTTGTADALSTQKRLAARCIDVRAVGHRGFVGGTQNGPNEDTIPSMMRAFRNGADASETDWRMNKDREWYQMHDQDVSRTTNGKGSIASLTNEQVANLRTPAGEIVPSFEQTIRSYTKNNNGKWNTTGRMLQFELKANPARLHVTSDDFQRMLDVLDTYGVREHVYWTSSVMSNLVMMHSIAPDMEYQFIASGNSQPAFTKIPKWVSQINVSLPAATHRYGGYANYIRAAHAHGYKISVRGANTKATWTKMVRMGANQIVTDNIGGYTKWCNALNR